MFAFRAPQRKTFPISDIKVLKRCYDPHTDSYLVVGKVSREDNKKQKTLKQFVIGWQSRHADKLIDCRYFIDKAAAMAEFDALARRHNRPDHKSLQKDWQQFGVYDWEDSMLVPYANILTEQQARDLVKRVCKDYGIPAARLVWQTPPEQGADSESKTESGYDDSDHTIYFQHRDAVSLLHELAHAVLTEQLEEDLEAHHPPAFVWKAIELYHRYAGFNLNYLIIGAHKFGLLGDIEENQIITPGPPKQDGNAPKPPQP